MMQINSLNALEQAIENTGANILFGFLVLLSFALLILATMFFLLAVRAAWRWLTRGSWGDAIASVERRAFHGRVAK